MRLIPLISEQIASIGYRPDPTLPWGDEGILVIQFRKNGKYYRYDGVPVWKFVAIVTDDESHGKAFNKHVRNVSYVYREVTPDEVARL